MDATTITSLPVAAIVRGDNDRQDFDPVALADLADSINRNGLAQPITVRPVVRRDLMGETVTYQIVAGERRFRAISTVLGWSTVPAIIRELSDEDASAIMLTENTARADLNPIEEGQAYQKRIDRFGWPVERIAQTAGVSPEVVKARVALLRLVPEAQHLVAHGQLPLGHAGAITELDANRQRIALRIYRESRMMPLATFRQVVGSLLQEQSQESLFDLESFWIRQVGTDAPSRGKAATTGAPERADLPAVTLKGTDSTGAVIDRYIGDLVAAGYKLEAATIGTLFSALVQGNFVKLPAKTMIDSTSAVQ